jgi:hypothetical protein
MRDLHKVFFDDESYNSGFGNAYELYGVDKKMGALAIVRPDQCKYLFNYGAQREMLTNGRCFCCIGY